MKSVPLDTSSKPHREVGWLCIEPHRNYLKRTNCYIKKEKKKHSNSKYESKRSKTAPRWQISTSWSRYANLLYFVVTKQHRTICHCVKQYFLIGNSLFTSIEVTYMGLWKHHWWLPDKISLLTYSFPAILCFMADEVKWIHFFFHFTYEILSYAGVKS